jgi:hypothetical protein
MNNNVAVGSSLHDSAKLGRQRHQEQPQHSGRHGGATLDQP